MSTTHPMPDGPSPDEVDRGMTELARFLADQDHTPGPADEPAAAVADTKVVRQLRAEVAEAHALLVLQGDEAPLLVDTPKVRKRRKQSAEAARLHALGQNPAARAWQAGRWRLVLTVTGVVALVLALSWSTAGVHEFAANGEQAWSPGWVLAWLVEPFLSLALLTIVAARAFMATRGQPLDHRTLRRTEWLFLGLTLGMNTWQHLPGVAERFDVSRLVLHALGPIVAVAVVNALPIIWRAFADLNHDPGHGTDPAASAAGPTAGATGPTYWANTTPATSPAAVGEVGSVGALVARARGLIAAGHLPANPSATRLQKTLRCGTDAARDVRDALRRTA